MVLLSRRLLLLALGCAMAARPAIAAAQPAVAPSAATQRPAAPDEPSLTREQTRLRGELARVQAEIERLKQTDLGLRDDYRLRARLADAEAIARRLTELDTQLQARRSSVAGAGAGPGVASAPWLGAEPNAAPTDGPSELDAKADILADQARRVQAQAVFLQARVDQLRSRRELRRRNAQLERDPFAPLEGPKRLMITGSPGGSTRIDTPTGAPGAGVATGMTPSPVAAVPGVGPASGPVSTPVAPSVQLREILDPRTLAEIRKLEESGSPASSLEALERAVVALSARAQHLDAQSKLLRAKAHRL